ncbi:MAG: 30S ribosomal protein S4 [Bacilli bacterium]|nr:30S ribosomal protein S4 [Bacilli bacterium]
MSRYTGSAYKKSRRVGFSTLESGKDLAKRPYRPGQHGQDRKAKPSNYAEQLNEKQKVKFTYGLTEKQFHQLFLKAGKLEGIHGENFLKLLESRLDNVAYRMGLSKTRRGARQVVNHGHILVNGKKVNIPSYLVQPGDVISVKEASKEHKAIKESLEAINNTVAYVNFDKAKMEGTFVRYPERSELSAEINEPLIVEYYSR